MRESDTLPVLIGNITVIEKLSDDRKVKSWVIMLAIEGISDAAVEDEKIGKSLMAFFLLNLARNHP